VAMTGHDVSMIPVRSTRLRPTGDAVGQDVPVHRKHTRFEFVNRSGPSRTVTVTRSLYVSRLPPAPALSDGKDRHEPEHKRRCRFESGSVSSRCYSQTGEWLAVGGADGTVRLYDSS
jgi:WD40 repeat protein